MTWSQRGERARSPPVSALRDPAELARRASTSLAAKSPPEYSSSSTRGTWGPKSCSATPPSGSSVAGSAMDQHQRSKPIMRFSSAIASSWIDSQSSVEVLSRSSRSRRRVSCQSVPPTPRRYAAHLRIPPGPAYSLPLRWLTGTRLGSSCSGHRVARCATACGSRCSPAPDASAVQMGLYEVSGRLGLADRANHTVAASQKLLAQVPAEATAHAGDKPGSLRHCRPFGERRLVQGGS